MTDLSVVRAKIVAAAKSQLGVPYVYGGTTPGVGLDCSGLAQWACAQAGVPIPRGSSAQWTASGPQRIGDALRGYLAFFYGGESPPSPRPGHVGIVTGPEEMIDAPYSGQRVRYDNFSDVQTVGPMDFWGYTDPAALYVPPPPPPVGTLCTVNLRVLSEGSTGVDVQTVQFLLNDRRHSGLNPDGIFGPLTKSALIDWQRFLGFATDGIVGQQVWQSLLGAPKQ